MQCPSCQAQVDSSQPFCQACGKALSSADGPSQDPMIGQTLGGKYKVVRLLGEGGMGAVYEGEQQLGTTKRKVAVKTLHPHLSHDPKIKARFEREVGTVAELEHPNTIQVYDFGSSADGILYIVMEFLQGKSLAGVLEKEGAMSPDRVERILQQVCGSLEEAHGRGIVHRDLKPDNVVLVDRAGKKDFVKVLDFGIAKRSHESEPNEQKLTQQGTVLGTPPYMSPEQFTGRPIDARSDIYSLGVMAYEMLTGKLPFAANTAWEWATQHMTQAPIPIESLPEGVRVPERMRRAVARALAKSPDDRFQSVKELIDAFGSAPSAPAEEANAAAAVGARSKTEVGTPLDLAAAFGGQEAQAASTGALTPAGANVSFPTPAAIPQAPPREDGRGRGRSTLLVAAGVLALASVGAIVFAMRANSGTGGGSAVFEPGGTPPPAASLTAATMASGLSAASNLTPSSTPASPDDVPPLVTGGHTVPHPAPARSGAGPGTGPAPAPAPPPAPSAPPVPKPGKYDGPECQTARRLRALGHPAQAESWAAACAAKGGTP